MTALGINSSYPIVPPALPSAWQQFRDRPCLFLARQLYAWRPVNLPPLPENPVTIVCISNTYRERPVIPSGDILIHAGDLTSNGSLAELQITLNWLQAQPHRIKIVVAGRSDQYLDRMKMGSRCRWRLGDPQRLYWGDIIYLEHRDAIVDCWNGRQLRIYGSPYSPMTIPSSAFQYPELDNVWDRIPDDTDILITHTPPYTHRDSLGGCKHLLNQIWRDPPRLHVFGCSLENSGWEFLHYDALQEAMENIEAEGGGFFNLLMVFKGLVQSFFYPDIKARTLLVNACINGGLWNLGRQPIVVVI
ncbi:uncharacterized protein N7479_009796 [Penicillium vulpinum]|uniref:Calcineurin-like phosphoesterase domain-containing protein n=1 Tax=Penicillium vulpinum TaxID=29845 RepID=A0A1V6RYB5_9EURO|nr:uncharacterized protein N7479_009796 [Penicillium vulpinum]KAJ5951383.1 hypothetical protein N7479_009796 [Penicillium vulpinum]OQE06626.1 hypothetical protein PENVUL_c017G08532 [Penicillium vulpinum]